MQRMTGETKIRYHDIAFLQEKLKAMILSQNKKNIQMLTCFSLENILNGCLLVLDQVFKKEYKVKTILLDEETGEVLREMEGMKGKYFDMDFLQDKGTVLFEIDVQGRGTIILDMF